MEVMELRRFSDNIECVEKHLEFIYENLHEILEKIDEYFPNHISDIQLIRGYILQYYKKILEIKLSIDNAVENKDINVISSAIDTLAKIRKNLRTIRKVLHQLKLKVLEELGVDKGGAFLEEIMDCRGNIYAAERHLSEFITVLENKRQIILKEKEIQAKEQAT